MAAVCLPAASRAVRLIDELGFRTQFLLATFAKLKAISARMDELPPADRRTGRRRPARKSAGRVAQRAVPPDAENAGEPGHAPPPHRPRHASSVPSTRPPRTALRRATCAWWSRSPNDTAIAA